MDPNITNKMMDLGETMKGGDTPIQTAPTQQKHYERIHFTTDKMPGLKDANVGDKVTLTLEAEICGIDTGEEYQTDNGQTPEIKTRVELKLLQGTSEISEQQVNPAKETIKEAQAKKEEKFNKDLGLDEEKKQNK